MSICACRIQTTKARCTYPAKLGTIYCGVHKNCRENASNPQPAKVKPKIKLVKSNLDSFMETRT